MRKCFEPFVAGPVTYGEFRERSGKEPLLKVSGKGKDAFSGKLTILIDGMTGSAAEIFAAGIQESGRGTLVGRQSRGGWLSYELKVAPGKPITLACTYRGSEGRLRSFDIPPIASALT